MTANLWATGWGVANVLCGLCYVRIGMALTSVMITGLGGAIRVTLPMVVKGSGLFKDASDPGSAAGLTLFGGVGWSSRQPFFYFGPPTGASCCSSTPEGSFTLPTRPPGLSGTGLFSLEAPPLGLSAPWRIALGKIKGAEPSPFADIRSDETIQSRRTRTTHTVMSCKRLLNYP